MTTLDPIAAKLRTTYSVGLNPLTHEAADHIDRLVKERDEARDFARRASYKVMTEIVPLTINTLGCGPTESLNEAAQRVVHERDEARAAFARARDEIVDARSDAQSVYFKRDALQLRYDALFAQSIHLAREVDRLNNEKADRVEAEGRFGKPLHLVVYATEST